MAKERIKENVIDAPTLFVGVGGTGCRIVRRVAEMCRPGERENVNFVCLDTNVNDLASVSGSRSHIYTVQTSNTQTVGNYLDYDADALNNWFPKNAVLYDKTVSEGAGQVRAISRLALNSTIKTGRIRPLLDAVDDLFRKSGKEMPLRYNNDKQKKPLFSRGLSVCRLLFNSFSKLKIDENYKEKRRLFY